MYMIKEMTVKNKSIFGFITIIIGICLSIPWAFYPGTIFAEYITNVATDTNEVFIIECKFNVIEHDIDCHMYIVPTQGSEEVLQRIANSI